MKNRKYFAVFFSIALMFSMLATGCSKSADGAGTSNPPVQSESSGEAPTGTASELGSMKSFSAATLDGGKFTQEDIAKKDITIINFWSMICGPCIEEMPEIASFAKALPDNVQMVTVCLDGTGIEEDVKKVLNEAGYEGITLLCGDGDYRTVWDNIQYTPTTVLVDSQGNLVGDAIIGGQEDLSGTFLAAVNAALKAGGKAEIGLEE